MKTIIDKVKKGNKIRKSIKTLEPNKSEIERKNGKLIAKILPQEQNEISEHREHSQITQNEIE